MLVAILCVLIFQTLVTMAHYGVTNRLFEAFKSWMKV